MINLKQNMMRSRLTRSRDKIIAGVCGGLANYFGLEISLVRIGFVLIGIVTAVLPLFLVYMIMWLIIPEE
jgi:phage shock protein C